MMSSDIADVLRSRHWPDSAAVLGLLELGGLHPAVDGKFAGRYNAIGRHTDREKRDEFPLLRRNVPL